MFQITFSVCDYLPLLLSSDFFSHSSLSQVKKITVCVEIKGSRWCSRGGAILDATDTKRRDAVDNIYWRISVLIRAPDGVEDTAVGGTN
jgi:hypothetical protein